MFQPKEKKTPQTIFDNLTKVWCAVPTLKLKNLWDEGEREKSWKRSLAHLLTVGTWKSSNKLSYNVTTLAFFSESFPLFFGCFLLIFLLLLLLLLLWSQNDMSTLCEGKIEGKRRNFLWSTSVGATLGQDYKMYPVTKFDTFLEGSSCLFGVTCF